MRALLFALVAGCASLPTEGDIALSFRTELALSVIPIPDDPLVSPAPVRNAGEVMTDTIAMGEQLLAARRPDPQDSRYLRTLLSCAYLAKGDTEAARERIRGFRPRVVPGFSRDEKLTDSLRYAITGCRAIFVRSILEEVLEEQSGMKAFVRQYGSFVGCDLPSRDAEDYEEFVELNTKKLEKTCFVELAGDPHQMEVAARARGDLRRLLAEQIYNDAAAIFQRLPDPDPEAQDGADIWLAAVGAALFVNYSLSLDDVVPDNMSMEQKKWHQELALAMFKRAREGSRRLLQTRHAALHGALVEAERRTMLRIAQ
jgi:hypothetical protein